MAAATLTKSLDPELPLLAVGNESIHPFVN